MKNKSFKPSVCECCKQTTEYDLPLSKGLAIMLIKIYNFAKKKNLNAVHLRKEMENNGLSSNEVGNASHLIFHGLLEDLPEAGNVAVTPKGFKFIAGEEVEKTIVIQKGTYKVLGYYIPENKTTLVKLLKNNMYWEGGYIQIGSVIKKTDYANNL